MELLIYSIATGLLFGFVNWFYWRRQGYSSVSTLLLGIFAFIALSHIIFRQFLN